MILDYWSRGKLVFDRTVYTWLVAGAVALLVQQIAGGWWFIVAGAIAGSVAGGFVDDAS